MISVLAGLMLQAAAPVPPPPAPPPPPPARPTAPARAKANLASLFTDEDYPAEALRNHEKGTVGFRLRVGTDGMVVGCTITSSSRSASLDATTCRLLTERARFSPARDRRGRPATDSVVGRITWRMDDSVHAPRLEAALLVITDRATPAGETNCSIVLNGKPQIVTSCGDPSPHMIEAARVSGRTVEQTMVWITIPAGESAPVDSGDHGTGDHGTLLFESDLMLTIAADGTALDCRIERNEGYGPLAGRPGQSNPCASYAKGKKVFEPAPAGTAADAPRIVSIKLRGYYRR